MKKFAVRGAALAAATGMALAGVSATANADTFLRLDNPTKTQKVGGSTVVVSLKGHTARLSPGMVALPSTRNAWVSGNLSVKINGGEPDGGNIEAGYMVGCQVEISSASIGAGASAGIGDSDGNVISGGTTNFGPSVKGTTGGSISLGAGRVGLQSLTYDRATWPEPGDTISPDWADPATDYDFKGSSGSLNYQDQTIGVDGCGGYAQAKFYAIISVQSGNTEGNVTLWSRPFTLG